MGIILDLENVRLKFGTLRRFCRAFEKIIFGTLPVHLLGLTRIVHISFITEDLNFAHLKPWFRKPIAKPSSAVLQASEADELPPMKRPWPDDEIICLLQENPERRRALVPDGHLWTVQSTPIPLQFLIAACRLSWQTFGHEESRRCDTVSRRREVWVVFIWELHWAFVRYRRKERMAMIFLGFMIDVFCSQGNRGCLIWGMSRYSCWVVRTSLQKTLLLIQDGSDVVRLPKVLAFLDIISMCIHCVFLRGTCHCRVISFMTLTDIRYVQIALHCKR